MSEVTGRSASRSQEGAMSGCRQFQGAPTHPCYRCGRPKEWHEAERRAPSSCVVADCTYSAADGSSYCTLHVVKWGREADPLPVRTASRSTDPSDARVQS